MSVFPQMVAYPFKVGQGRIIVALTLTLTHSLTYLYTVQVSLWRAA